MKRRDTNRVNEYDVFLSYRHKPRDNKICKKAHTLLETYKPPRRYKSADIKRVFRDDAELPVAGILSNSIAEALKSARTLLVICSTDTPESQWVDKEVRTFIELGRSEKIYALLIDGDPAKSFPSTLRFVPGIESRTLDIRTPGGGHSIKKLKNELLKVVSAATDTPYDQLRGANRRRKLRRSILTGLALSVFLLVSGFYSLFQWVQASYYYIHAQREELVISDIIGSISSDLFEAAENIPEAAPVLIDIIGSNNIYLDRIAELDGSSNSIQKEKGRNYLNLARAYLMTGDKAKTVEASQKAIKIFENSAKNSRSEEKNSELAISYFLSGIYLQSLKDYEEAVVLFKKAAEVYEKLESIAPHGDYTSNRADVYNSIGVCSYMFGDYKQAANNFIEEASLRKKLLDLSLPENQLIIADLYSIAADCYSKIKDYESSSEYYTSAATLYQGLNSNNSDIGYNKAYAISLYSLGINLSYLESDDAEKYMRNSIVEADKVAQSMPEFTPYYLSMYAMYDLLYAYDEKKEEALSISTEAYHINPTDGFIAHVYAYSLLLNDYYDEAKAILGIQIADNISTADEIKSDLDLFIIKGRSTNNLIRLRDSL